MHAMASAQSTLAARNAYLDSVACPMRTSNLLEIRTNLGENDILRKCCGCRMLTCSAYDSRSDSRSIQTQSEEKGYHGEIVIELQFSFL